MGELALSSHNVCTEELEKLKETVLKVQEKDFKFKQLTGDDLKAFWQKQGGHYNFCIQPRLRNIKKNQKLKKLTDRKDKSKRARVSFEIAGVFYSDINKVKSKSRAILNMKQDGDKLTGNDEAFIKEIIKFHSKTDEKMKDFDHFEVGEHKDHEKTRCFFVVRKNGEKEDFSIGKCTQNLEKQ